MLLRDLYEKEYAKRDPLSRVTLARTLRESALVENKPERLFVLWREVRDLAAKGGDLELGMEAVDALSREFRIQPLRMKERVLSTALSAKLGMVSAALTAHWGLRLTTEAIDANDDNAATDLLATTLKAASRSKDPVLISRAKRMRISLDSLTTEEKRIEPSFAAVRVDPDSPAANFDIGRYFCVYRADWKRGLKFLKKGADDTLRRVARNDLEKPTSPDRQAELGKSWHEAGEATKGEDRAAFLGRAAYWYRQAMPGIDGIESLYVRKKLTEISEEFPIDDRVSVADLHVQCWVEKSKRWKRFPLDRFSFNRRGEALEAKNTSGVFRSKEDGALIAHNQELTGDFSAELQVKRCFRIGLIALGGEGRAVQIRPVNGSGHVRIERAEGKLSFTVNGKAAEKFHFGGSTDAMHGYLYIQIPDGERCRIQDFRLRVD